MTTTGNGKRFSANVVWLCHDDEHDDGSLECRSNDDTFVADEVAAFLSTAQPLEAGYTRMASTLEAGDTRSIATNDISNAHQYVTISEQEARSAAAVVYDPTTHQRMPPPVQRAGRLGLTVDDICNVSPHAPTDRCAASTASHATACHTAPPLEEYGCLPFFHAECPAAVSAQVLAGAAVGSYLLRSSMRHGLSLTVRGQTEIKHYAINTASNASGLHVVWRLINARPRPFKSLADLIAHYTVHPLSPREATCLANPVVHTQVAREKKLPRAPHGSDAYVHSQDSYTQLVPSMAPNKAALAAARRLSDERAMEPSTLTNAYEEPDPNQPALYAAANAARLLQHVYEFPEPDAAANANSSSLGFSFAQLDLHGDPKGRRGVCSKLSGRALPVVTMTPVYSG